MNEHIKKYGVLALNCGALLAGIWIASTHIGQLLSTPGLVLICCTLFLGYQLGKWTCHAHARNIGLWVTVGIFTILNFTHSLIDGASLAAGFGRRIESVQWAALLSHELARQPALYIMILAILAPLRSKWLLAPLLVTGVWWTGLQLGKSTGSIVRDVHGLELVTNLGLFLFLGDILHHLREEWEKITGKNKCCHDH